MASPEQDGVGDSEIEFVSERRIRAPQIHSGLKREHSPDVCITNINLVPNPSEVTPHNHTHKIKQETPGLSHDSRGVLPVSSPMDDLQRHYGNLNQTHVMHCTDSSPSTSQDLPFLQSDNYDPWYPNCDAELPDEVALAAFNGNQGNIINHNYDELDETRREDEYQRPFIGEHKSGSVLQNGCQPEWPHQDMSQLSNDNSIFIPESSSHDDDINDVEYGATYTTDASDDDGFELIEGPEVARRHRKRTATTNRGAKTESHARKRSKLDKPRTEEPTSEKPSVLGGESMLNFRSLASHHLIEHAQANIGLAPQPGFSTRVKANAFKEICQSLSSDNKRQHTRDRRLLEESTKCFVRNNGIKADGDGKWSVNGMNAHLHHHQTIGVAKMRDLEKSASKPHGGILADEMGFGKTVMTIATVIDDLNLRRKEGKPLKPRATLIVAPASLTHQWFSEITKHVQQKWNFRIEIYRSSEQKHKSHKVEELEDHDIVITTYNEVTRSMPNKCFPKNLKTQREREEWWKIHLDAHKGTLHRAHFRRVVLDEAQSVKNYKSRTSEAASLLNAKFRWALSGTPVQNGLEEFFAYFRFLDLVKEGEYTQWRQQYCKRGSLTRLKTRLEKFMIRRTHEDRLFGRPLIQLPEIKNAETILVELNTTERFIYDVVEAKLRERVEEAKCARGEQVFIPYALVLVLRLRQITDHSFLIEKTMAEFLEDESIEMINEVVKSQHAILGNAGVKGFRSLLANVMTRKKSHMASGNSEYPKHGTSSLLQHLQELARQPAWEEGNEKTQCLICHKVARSPVLTDPCNHLFCFECLNAEQYESAFEDKGPICPQCHSKYRRYRSIDVSNRSPSEASNAGKKRKADDKGTHVEDEIPTLLDVEGPIWQSSKTQAAVNKIEAWLQADPTSKIIIFTQFRGVVRIFQRICGQKGWRHTAYHGGLSHEQRNKNIEEFSDNPYVKILLAGLKAGSVGLNLTAANRVLIVDPWWNISVEDQAFCRTFRIGQTRSVEVARLAVKDSIDMRLHELQERKADEIAKVITGNGAKLKLTTDEILDLFGTTPRKTQRRVTNARSRTRCLSSNRIEELDSDEESDEPET